MGKLTVPKCISERDSQHGKTTTHPWRQSHQGDLPRLPNTEEKHMHNPQTSKQNLHTVPECIWPSTGKSWVIVAERFPAGLASNDNGKTQRVREIHTQFRLRVKTQSIPLWGKREWQGEQLLSPGCTRPSWKEVCAWNKRIDNGPCVKISSSTSVHG